MYPHSFTTNPNGDAYMMSVHPLCGTCWIMRSVKREKYSGFIKKELRHNKYMNNYENGLKAGTAGFGTFYTRPRLKMP